MYISRHKSTTHSDTPPYGGEKFICLLPDTQHLGAMNIPHRQRSARFTFTLVSKRSP
jgi:hypothetical protein